MNRPLVLIESPYSHPHRAGLELHRAYLELCFLDSISRNECPIATHKLYTACLDDTKPDERQLGMEMIHTLLSHTDLHAVAVYFDLSISSGMKWGIDYATKHSKEIEYRSLYGRMYLPPSPSQP